MEMDMHDIFNQDTIVIEGDTAFLTLAIPVSFLTDFENFLSSSISITKYIQKRIRINEAIEKSRSEDFQSGLKANIDANNLPIVNFYNSLMGKGAISRVAIKETRDFFNKKSGCHSFTCGTVELIIKRAARMAKSEKREAVKCQKLKP